VLVAVVGLAPRGIVGLVSRWMPERRHD
jgi:hypothetical protein